MLVFADYYRRYALTAVSIATIRTAATNSPTDFIMIANLRSSVTVPSCIIIAGNATSLLATVSM